MILPGSFSALQSAVAADAAKRNNLTEEEKQMIRSLLEGSGLSYNPTPEPQESDAVDTRSGKKTSTLGPVTVTAEREPQLPQVPPSTELIPPKYTDLPSDEAQDNMRVLSTGPGYNIVQKKDGSVEQNSGTVAARANNPGNLISGSLSDKYGAVGQDANRFAVFPNKKAGMDALTEWWSVKHKDEPIGKAMQTYAPPAENDTTGYTEFLTRGFDKNSTFDKLNPKQKKDLVNRIAQFEGSNKPVQKTVGLKPFSASNPPQDSEVSKLPLTAEQLRAAKRYRDGQQGLRNDAANAYEEFMNKKVPATETASTKTQVSPEETGLSTPVIKGEPYKEEAYTPPARHEEPAQGFEDSSNIAMGPTGKAKTPAAKAPTAKAPAAKAPTAKKPAGTPPANNTTVPNPAPTPTTKTNADYSPLINRDSEIRRLQDSIKTDIYNYDKLKSYENQYERLRDEDKQNYKPSGNAGRKPTRPNPPDSQAPSGSNSPAPTPPSGSSGGSSSMLPKTFQQLQVQSNVAKTAQGSAQSLADLQNTDVSGNKQKLTFAPGATYGPTDTNAESLRTGEKKVGDVNNPVFYNKVVAERGVPSVEPRSTTSSYGRGSSAPPPPAAQEIRYNPVVFNTVTGKWEERDGEDTNVVIRTSYRLHDLRDASDRANPGTVSAVADIDRTFNAEAVDWTTPTEGSEVSPSGDTIKVIATPSSPLFDKRFRVLPSTMHVNDTLPEINRGPHTGLLESGMPVAVSATSGDYVPVAPMFAKNNDWFKTVLIQQHKATLTWLRGTGITPDSVSSLMLNPLESIDTMDEQKIEEHIKAAKALRDAALKGVYEIQIKDKDGNIVNISPLNQYLGMIGKVQDNPVAAAPPSVNTGVIPNILNSIGRRTLRQRGVSIDIGGGATSSSADVREAADSPMTMVGKAETHADIEMKRSLERIDVGYGITKDSVPSVRKILNSSGKWASIASNIEPYTAEEKIEILRKIDNDNGNKYFGSGLSDMAAASAMLEAINPATLLQKGQDFPAMKKKEKDRYIDSLILAAKVFNAFSDDEHQIGPIHTVQSHSMAVKPDIEMPKSFGVSSQQSNPDVKVAIASPDPTNPQPIVPPGNGPNISWGLPNTNPGTANSGIIANKLIARNTRPNGTKPEETKKSISDYSGQLWKAGIDDWDKEIGNAKDALWNKIKSIPNRTTDKAKAATFAREVLRSVADTIVESMNAQNSEAQGGGAKPFPTIDSMWAEAQQILFPGLTDDNIANLVGKVPGFKVPGMGDPGRPAFMKAMKEFIINKKVSANDRKAYFNNKQDTVILNSIYDQFANTSIGNDISSSSMAPTFFFPRNPFEIHPSVYAEAYSRALKSVHGIDVGSFTEHMLDGGKWRDDYWNSSLIGKNKSSLKVDTEANRIHSTILGFVIP